MHSHTDTDRHTHLYTHTHIWTALYWPSAPSGASPALEHWCRPKLSAPWQDRSITPALCLTGLTLRFKQWPAGEVFCISLMEYSPASPVQEHSPEWQTQIWIHTLNTYTHFFLSLGAGSHCTAGLSFDECNGRTTKHESKHFLNCVLDVKPKSKTKPESYCEAIMIVFSSYFFSSLLIPHLPFSTMFFSPIPSSPLLSYLLVFVVPRKVMSVSSSFSPNAAGCHTVRCHTAGLSGLGDARELIRVMH